MTDLEFKYVTEDDDRFVMNHFERNETGKFECQHCELMLDKVDKPTMAKHLRRKHPLDTKTRNMEAFNAADNVETDPIDGPSSDGEATENDEPQHNDSDLTLKEAEHRYNIICEYKLVGQYKSDAELDNIRNQLGFSVRSRGNEITYRCKNYGTNILKDNWCYSIAKSFNLKLYQKGEHADHCCYRRF